MKQVLLRSSSAKNILARAKQAAPGIRVSKNVILITSNGQFSYPVYFEVDEGFEHRRRSGVDLDDMTNEAFWRWWRQRN
ncbi:MAG: hypothetical protein IKN71_01655 [Alphaproteobacteria bacterium]|nr:hypothetical protein [Alphaproteobacteria bacterium]